jgi:hypothetical protein
MRNHQEEPEAGTVAISFTLAQCLPLKKDSKQHEALLISQLHYTIAFPDYLVSLKTGPYTSQNNVAVKQLLLLMATFTTSVHFQPLKNTTPSTDDRIQFFILLHCLLQEDWLKAL